MAGPSIVDAIRVADRIVRSHVALQGGEEVVVVADTYTEREILDALAGAISAAGGEFTLVIQPARRADEAHKLTRAVIQAYQNADVLITAAGASSLSLYGSSQFLWPRLAAKQTRLFTLSEPSLRQMTEGASAADYHEVEKVGLRILDALRGVDRVRVTTALGTDVAYRIGGRDLINLASFARAGGDEGGIPSGEVSCDPVVGSAEGRVVIDGPIGNIERPAKPLTIVAEGGKWVAIEGEGPGPDRLRHLFATIENADNVAEFALGTNAWARRTGVVSEEKKRLGVMHTAYGRSNRSADWRCEVWSTVHGDIVLYDPTVEADGRVIMRDGKLLV